MPHHSVLSAGFSEAMVNIFTGVDPKEALTEWQKTRTRITTSITRMKIDSGEEEKDGKSHKQTK